MYGVGLLVYHGCTRLVPEVVRSTWSVHSKQLATMFLSTLSLRPLSHCLSDTSTVSAYIYISWYNCLKCENGFCDHSVCHQNLSSADLNRSEFKLLAQGFLLVQNTRYSLHDFPKIQHMLWLLLTFRNNFNIIRKRISILRSYHGQKPEEFVNSSWTPCSRRRSRKAAIHIGDQQFTQCLDPWHGKKTEAINLYRFYIYVILSAHADAFLLVLV